MPRKAKCITELALDLQQENEQLKSKARAFDRLGREYVQQEFSMTTAELHAALEKLQLYEAKLRALSKQQQAKRTADKPINNAPEGRAKDLLSLRAQARSGDRKE
jgi:cell division septum initiation protein DivIVA